MCAILAAAGRGARMGQPKQLLELAGKPIAAWSLQTIAGAPAITQIVVACEPDERSKFERLAAAVGGGKVCKVVSGGARRQDSVFAALRSLADVPDFVVIHDGARPFVSEDILARVLEQAREHGGAIAAVPVKDTIKLVNEGATIDKTIPRERLWAAQTPQAFSYDLLFRAHVSAEADGFMGTDDAELVERLGGASIAIVESTYENLKITTPEDLIVAERIAAGRVNRAVGRVNR
ncbi:MAG TPA: 2-C-methyl-D-erythritol 4-phosphate cytidylyltransferase [Candidatus Eremiobacteraceae bacterium]|nr:2-C-methyl-D-erythritol 4-phosphate cytidylyltransferase [Candidatus Eremiobacteraceae bacterium]